MVAELKRLHLPRVMIPQTHLSPCNTNIIINAENVSILLS